MNQCPDLAHSSAKNDRDFCFLADQPAQSDEFSRKPFSKTLANALRLPLEAHGLIVGIEGEWGSGKSTLINFVREELAKDKKTIVVSFNPWMISGSSGLVEALLSQIASAVSADPIPQQAKRGLKAGGKLLGYIGLLKHLKYLKYVPGTSWAGFISESLGGAAEGVADFAEQGQKAGDELVKDIENTLPQLDISKRKGEVVSALKELDCPIVVIVDDLDRLLPTEIRSVFQAIKAVADFPRVAYLLAYDVDVVSRALDDSCDGRGRSYLEKIVQVAYPLPHLFSWQLRSFTAARLTSLIKRLGIVMQDFESSLWDEAVTIAARLARHPRDIIRLVNRLMVSLPGTVGEVNICDVVVFEAVSLVSPDIRSAVQQHPEEFTGEIWEGDKGGSETDWSLLLGGKAENRKEQWLRHLPEFAKKKSAIQTACRFLFPMLSDSGRDGASLDQLRISSSQRLMRLFSLTSIEGIPDVSQIHRLLNDVDEFSSALDVESAQLLELLGWISAYGGSATVASPESILEVLINFANSALIEGNLSVELSNGISEVMLRVFEKGGDSIGALFEKIVVKAPLSTSHDILLRSAEEHGLWSIHVDRERPRNDRLVQDQDLVIRSIETWCNRVKTAAGDGSLLAEPKLRAVLFRWAQLGAGYSVVQESVRQLCQNAEGLAKFVGPYISDRGLDLDELNLVWNEDDLIELIEKDQVLAGTCAGFCRLLRSEQVKGHLAKRRLVEKELKASRLMEIEPFPLPEGDII